MLGAKTKVTLLSALIVLTPLFLAMTLLPSEPSASNAVPAVAAFNDQSAAAESVLASQAHDRFALRR